MEDENSEDIGVIEDDYYTFLNLPKDASVEDITNAYRRFSKLYHPDKHLDPARKKDAELLFHKTKKAYEVLSDPHKRAIYDNLGLKGLETEGWEIVQRTKTPQEIREEYEELARKREEQRLQRRTNPTGTFTLSINATELWNQPDEDEIEYDDISPVEISGISISQNIEAPLTLQNKLMISGEASARNGNGSGSLSVTGKRLLEENKWIECGMTVGNDVGFNIKHFRPLTRHLFGSGTIHLDCTSLGIRPAIETSLAMQLDTNVMGYLTFRAGVNSAMTTSIAYNKDGNKVEGAITLGIPHSYLSLSYMYNFKGQKLKLHTALKTGTFGVLFEYTAHKKISEQSTMGATVSVGVPTGVKLKIVVKRATQTYIFPIQLCDEPMASPVFYATLVPLCSYALIKRMIIDPINTEQKERAKEKQKEANKNRMAEMRREAAAAVNLMGATLERVRSEEEARKGLIIVKALYGQLVTLSDISDNKDRVAGDEVIDVTVPLQCLVKDSKLVLFDASKSQLPGFYDPCVSEDKALYVQYLFHSHLHQVVAPDNEPLVLPKQAHRLSAT